MEELLAYVNAITTLPNPLKEHLTAILREKVFGKKEFLLKAGLFCRSICFIKKGLVRCFYHKADQEETSWFMKEGDFIISVESFFK